MKRYIKDREIKNANQIVVIKDGKQVINPGEDLILQDGWVEYKSKVLTEEELINSAKWDMIYEIENYDKSENVNSFILNGEKHWLDWAMRMKVKDRCERDLADGIEVSNLRINDFSYPVAPQKGLDMLNVLDRYAIKCYDNTEAHKDKIRSTEWKTPEDVRAYDYKTGYPEILNFDLLKI